MRLATVDNKNRVRILGTKTGEKYLVYETANGWVLNLAPNPKQEPSGAPSRNKKEWAGSKLGLGEHLARLRKLGLKLQRHPITKQPVPPCRF